MRLFAIGGRADRRGVAQPGSASALGAEGRRFESCLPDHPSASTERQAYCLFSVFTSALTFTSTSLLPTLLSILSPVVLTSLPTSAATFCAVLATSATAF